MKQCEDKEEDWQDFKIPSLTASLALCCENPDTRPFVVVIVGGIGTDQLYFKEHIFLQRDQKCWLLRTVGNTGNQRELSAHS